MLKFDEQKAVDSVNGALALRAEIERITDEIWSSGFDGIYWLGIGGTWASCLQAEVFMKERSALPAKMERVLQTQSILIFPEGSHNYDLNRLIKPLYDGPVNLALKNGKKIVPVALVFDFLKKRQYNYKKRVASKRKSSLPATRFLFCKK